MHRLRLSFFFPLLLNSLFAFTAGASQFKNDQVQQDGWMQDGSQVVIAEKSSEQRSKSFVGIPSPISALFDSIEVMQSQFFEVWQGTWPSASDWTAAVMSTQLSATLSVMSQFQADRAKMKARDDDSSISVGTQSFDYENLINQYFTQIASFYFGQSAFTLRMQAYDDMLWVTLGWLESIQFINLHTRLHSAARADLKGSAWYGRQFVPQFAHRARIFYDLASRGWDTSLCDGGMIWSPYLIPYKNAITNQLYITASINMYLYFPGDDNSSPFVYKDDVRRLTGLPPAPAHDPKYLEAAVKAYRWLRTSNMRNENGLYTDGFHITGWRGGKNGTNGSQKCDIRDEMVYTYNQGVLLSGLKGLWEATGVTYYLDDGHELIQNVITATGWHNRDHPDGWKWAGIGRNGILEEACDSTGSCNQDGQTFKGIFFHHLSIFCTPLLNEESYTDKDVDTVGLNINALHMKRCQGYRNWIKHNANAAYLARDDRGRFGTWWSRPYSHHGNVYEERAEREADILPNEHRNEGLQEYDDARSHEAIKPPSLTDYRGDQPASDPRRYDPNNRGRGRTVETQSGGVAVLRALWQSIELEKNEGSVNLEIRKLGD